MSKLRLRVEANYGTGREFFDCTRTLIGVKYLVENFNVVILTGRVRPLNPHQVPREDVDPQLVAQGGLPRVLVGREGIPLCRGSLLGGAEVGSADFILQSLKILNYIVTFLTPK